MDSYRLALLIANSAFFASCISLCVVLGYSTLKAFRVEGIWTAREREDVGLSIAWFTAFFGGALLRGWSALMQKLPEWGYSNDWLEHDPIPIVGAAIFVTGTICAIRVFTGSPRQMAIHFSFIMAFILAMILS